MPLIGSCEAVGMLPIFPAVRSSKHGLANSIARARGKASAALASLAPATLDKGQSMLEPVANSQHASKVQLAHPTSGLHRERLPHDGQR